VYKDSGKVGVKKKTCKTDNRIRGWGSHILSDCAGGYIVHKDFRFHRTTRSIVDAYGATGLRPMTKRLGVARTFTRRHTKRRGGQPGLTTKTVSRHETPRVLAYDRRARRALEKANKRYTRTAGWTYETDGREDEEV
jgi:hypothetical protein